LHRTRPDRWRQLPKPERSVALAPPRPIPGDWYDVDYFETGAKSNWTNGYDWSGFCGLFRDTARFVVSLFPGAQTFLDAGCGKGFLIRALREEGKDAWGFDFSPWAIRNADRSAALYLELASIDSYRFEKQFDVVLAFSLLESLSEEQAQKFLLRAHQVARTAIFAVILTQLDPAPCAADNDLSHITLRPREWWNEQFLRAGWQGESEPEDLQEACRSHPLPLHMNWTTYLRLR